MLTIPMDFTRLLQNSSFLHLRNNIQQYQQTPALLCSDKRCTESWPAHDVINIEFNLCSVFIGGGNGSTLRKPLWCDQKAAKNCFRHDCKSHLQPQGFESHDYSDEC